MDLKDFLFEELGAHLFDLGEPKYKAEQIFRALHQNQVSNINEITNISKELRSKLASNTEQRQLKIKDIKKATDGTRKYQFETFDGHLIESVFIPEVSAGRNAICISSQVGCAMGCKFCATAAIKLKRHLFPGEIVSQVYLVNKDIAGTKENHDCKTRCIDNIVYMGMGEPLHNYKNVVSSIKILTNSKGMNFSSRRITVSTCGIVKNLVQLGKDTNVYIAISLNASNDAQRNMVMPVNKKWNIQKLLDACRQFPMAARRRITFEYVLLAGVNDSNEDAKQLRSLLTNLRCKINLIPFNEHPFSPYKQPSHQRVLAFQNILLKAGFVVFIRSTRGDDVNGACGMLGGEKLEQLITIN